MVVGTGQLGHLPGAWALSYRSPMLLMAHLCTLLLWTPHVAMLHQVCKDSRPRWLRCQRTGRPWSAFNQNVLYCHLQALRELARMDASDNILAISPATAVPANEAPARRHAKRDRVSLACQRCQRRKQRCDGREPCRPCSKYGSQCSYVAHPTLAAGERKEYTRALEQRVAELESQLASLGQPDADRDHYQSDSPERRGVQTPWQPSCSRCQTRHDEGNDILVAVRDLSLSASGHYIGATSNRSLSRVLTSVSQGAQYARSTDGNDEDPAPKSAYDHGLQHEHMLPAAARDTMDRLKVAGMQHIATRYPFLHSPYVMSLFEDQQSTASLYDRCMLSLVCAVSGRWLESAGEMGYFYSDRHYELALKHSDDILSLGGMRAIDYLLLLALYCTRAPKNPGAWTYIGAAMRLCIELGLHRAKPRHALTVTREMEKRKFWTTYCMDRDVCIAIGRPPSISDHDIDTELPLHVDEAECDEREIRQAATEALPGKCVSYTTLTPFIHRLKLKFIESKIQHVAYRVDKPEPLTSLSVDGFLAQLDEWYQAIPVQAQHFEPRPGVPYDGMEFYTIHYNRCVRLLLYPQLSIKPVTAQYLERCARASAGVICDYRQIHRRFAVGFSALSIQSVFLSGASPQFKYTTCADSHAGLTLVYCVWLSSLSLLSDFESTITDCQLLLYIIAERYPSSRKYRDLFERIKNSLTQDNGTGPHVQYAQTQLAAGTPEYYQGLSDSWLYPVTDDFTRMLYDMTAQMPVQDGGPALNDGIPAMNFEAWWPR